jgi:hypothetical protein
MTLVLRLQLLRRICRRLRSLYRRIAHRGRRSWRPRGAAASSTSISRRSGMSPFPDRRACCFRLAVRRLHEIAGIGHASMLIAVLTWRIGNPPVLKVESGFPVITNHMCDREKFLSTSGPTRATAITQSGEEMTSSIARSTRLRRIAPAILIATAAFGAVAGVSMEAAGVASARPNQCADGQCPPPHPPPDNGHMGGPANVTFPQSGPPEPTQDFVCGGPCISIPLY